MHDCSKNAVCRNTFGSYDCVCNDGFSDFGNGKACLFNGTGVDIDNGLRVDNGNYNYKIGVNMLYLMVIFFWKNIYKRNIISKRIE